MSRSRIFFRFPLSSPELASFSSVICFSILSVSMCLLIRQLSLAFYSDSLLRNIRPIAIGRLE